ncbi:hypothetical protein CPLU01_15710 [Colletotrichum plurivorum]|uniref:Uncharacterized protein n=1 Tax=Colletotrichum plurivorum TaxID=2175906 RepID=A0A8H6MT83_9PEZI|nr:hypothetical protein CPLU01_15710 [Colletotrichum plurivorum]
MILKVMKTDDLQLTNNASGPPSESGCEAEGAAKKAKNPAPRTVKPSLHRNRSAIECSSNNYRESKVRLRPQNGHRVGGAGFASLGRDLEERRSFLPSGVVRRATIMALAAVFDCPTTSFPSATDGANTLPRDGGMI